MELGSLVPVKLSNRTANSILSIFLSIAFAVTPIILYFLADLYSGATELILVAIFYFSISAVFFFSKFFHHKVALFKIIKWFFESFSTFGRDYRLFFYAFLFFCGGLTYLVRAIKIAHGS